MYLSLLETQRITRGQHKGDERRGVANMCSKKPNSHHHCLNCYKLRTEEKPSLRLVRSPSSNNHKDIIDDQFISIRKLVEVAETPVCYEVVTPFVSSDHSIMDSTSNAAVPQVIDVQHIVISANN